VAERNRHFNFEPEGKLVMRKLLTLWIALAAVAIVSLSVSNPVRAGCIIGGGFFGACNNVAPSYQGPGDIVSGALIWGSCSRVYSLALASTSASLCDLVDTSVGSTAVCTLRGSSRALLIGRCVLHGIVDTCHCLRGCRRRRLSRLQGL
jgi:hypothetical protein